MNLVGYVIKSFEARRGDLIDQPSSYSWTFLPCCLLLIFTFKKGKPFRIVKSFFVYKYSKFMVFGMDTAIAYGGTLKVQNVNCLTLKNIINKYNGVT